MSDINVLDAREKMEFVILNYEENLAILRTGRANASLLNKIECDYYGEKMPINQICAISVPEPRQLLVKPYDRNDLKSVLAAISASNIGINPINDGVSIRLIIPPLNEERRRDLVRDAKNTLKKQKLQFEIFVAMQIMQLKTIQIIIQKMMFIEHKMKFKN